MSEDGLEPVHGKPSGDDGNDEVEWTFVATAPDQLVAEMYQEVLLAESIPCMLAPGDTVSFLGVSPNPVRLMVPAEMEGRALAALAALSDGSPTVDGDVQTPD